MKSWVEQSHLAGIAIIAVTMLVGPMAAPDEFDWLRHTTSEQAGQGVAGAWIMRTGFVAYGAGVMLSTLFSLGRRPFVRAPLFFFGAGLIAAAIWSNASILPAYPSDLSEDWRHSVASGLVGLAFALAAAGRLFVLGGWRWDVIAWVGLVASVVIPILMFNVLPGLSGLLQRAMFAISMVLVFDEFRRGGILAQPLGMASDRTRLPFR
jgi:hypothetical protein